MPPRRCGEIAGIPTKSTRKNYRFPTTFCFTRHASAPAFAEARLIRATCRGTALGQAARTSRAMMGKGVFQSTGYRWASPTLEPAANQIGSVTKARSPPSGLFDSTTSPPCARNMFRAIGKPSPTPPVSRLRLCSSR